MLFALIFFFNDTATTEIYTLSLHDALPICVHPDAVREQPPHRDLARLIEERDLDAVDLRRVVAHDRRSEEHTSELQSRLHLVCRLLLEKKKKENTNLIYT